MKNLEALHPGMVLKTMFLEPLKLSVYRVAKDIHGSSDAPESNYCRRARYHTGHCAAAFEILRPRRNLLARAAGGL